MGNRAAKGSKFERQFCTELSRWWTDGQRSDCFWRTATSGARATVRTRKGQDTAGHYGDICATDAAGAAFTDLFCTELKRGYPRVTIADLLDKPARAAKQPFEEWIEKAYRCHREAGSWSWLLVTKRDCREALAFLPDLAWCSLFPKRLGPVATLCPDVLLCSDHGFIRGMPLSAFFTQVQPASLRALARKV